MKVITKEEELRRADIDRQKLEEEYGKYGYNFSIDSILEETEHDEC